MRGLVDAGVEVDVFPIYPFDPGMSRYRLDILGESVLPQDRLHHVSGPRALRSLFHRQRAPVSFFRPKPPPAWAPK